MSAWLHRPVRIDMRRLPVTGGEVACHITGSGPAVVLLHPTMMDSRLWADQVALLAPRYTVIAVDQRGHGRSPDPETPYDPAADVAAALSAVGVDRAAVIGMGVGGEYAVRLAVSASVPISALVIATPTLGWLALETEPDRFQDEAEESVARVLDDPAFEPMLDAVSSSDGDAIAEWISTNPEILSDGHPARELVRRMAKDNRRTVYQGELVLPAHPDLGDLLMGLKVPTLVLSSNAGPRAWTTALLDRLRDAREVRLPTSVELVNLELPDTFNAAVLEFLTTAV